MRNFLATLFPFALCMLRAQQKGEKPKLLSFSFFLTLSRAFLNHTHQFKTDLHKQQHQHHKHDLAHIAAATLNGIAGAAIIA